MKVIRERDLIKALMSAWSDGRVSGYYISKETGISAALLKRYKDNSSLIGRMSLEKAEKLSDLYIQLNSYDFKK